MPIDIRRLQELETRLFKAQDKVRELRWRADLVNSEYWQHIDKYIMAEMWRQTELEEANIEDREIQRCIGNRQALRRILDFEKAGAALAEGEKKVKELQEAYQEAIK